MPVRETLPQVTIKLTKEIKPIIDLYIKVLEKHQIPLTDSDHGAKADVAVGESKLRLGVWNRYVTNNLESLSGTARGAKAIVLDAVDIEFTPPAEILRRCYVAFLNAMLLKEHLGPKHTQGEVTSKYAVVHLLLNRLVSVALDNNLDAKNDGERILIVLKVFINGLTHNQLLYNSAMLGSDKVSNFLKVLSTDHSPWNARIKHMVDAVRTIHAPRQAVTEALTSLKETEKALQRQLIAFLDPQQDVAAFANDWLDTQLTNIEHKLIENNASSQKRTVIEQGEHRAVQQLIILIIKTGPKKDKQKKIELLYDALEQTRVVQEVLSQLDLLITTGGWIPILSGVLNVQAFSQLLKDHSKLCKRALKLNAEQVDVLDQKAGRGLLRYQAVTGEGLQALMLDSSLRLDQLEDPSLRQQIYRLMGASVVSLVHLQGGFKGEYQLINESQLAAMGLGGVAMTHALMVATKPEPGPVGDHASQRLLLEQQRVLDQSDQTLYATQTLHQVLTQNCQDVNVLAVLLWQGADLTALQLTPGIFQGYSALHIAVSHKNTAACQWLLKKGVDVNIHDSRGETPMDKASKRGFRDIINWLHERGGKSNFADVATQRLHELIDAEDVTEENSTATPELIEELSKCLSQGADVNGISRWQNAWYGDRPLHTLLVKGNQKLIAWFINMGADLQLKDERKGETPVARLHRTKAFFKDQTIAFLEENFPDHLQAQPAVIVGYSPQGVFQQPSAKVAQPKSNDNGMDPSPLIRPHDGPK